MTGLITLLVIVSGLIAAIVLYCHINSQGKNTDHISTLTDAIEDRLPQTQCGQCHYSGCRPYAMAIAKGDVDIDQCPPGGAQTIKAIADLLGKESNHYLTQFNHAQASTVAVIDEDLCIGCVKCIDACPVDAIIGAPKLMHSVIKKYCTGCELCIPPCPVNCISMVPARVKTNEWVWAKPEPVYREST